MKRDFIDEYKCGSKFKKCPPMYFHGDSSSRPTQAQKIIDERVANAMLTIGDPNILLDLRKLNGNPKATLFDDFWTELSPFLHGQKWRT